MITRHDKGGWTCWCFSVGRMLFVHWHVGRLPDATPETPWFRLRHVEVWGKTLRLKYHVI